MNEREWSKYQLSKQSGIPMSALSNMFNRTAAPTFSTIETLCECFGITLCRFFATENDNSYLTKEQELIFSKWISLNKEQKELIIKLIDNM